MIESSSFTPELQQTSDEMDRILAQVTTRMQDTQLAYCFEACFPDVLGDISMTTKGGRPYTFIETGDIHAMWQRDASVQVLHNTGYARENPGIAQMILGIINQQAEFVIRDPYANAFLQNEHARSPHWMDQTEKRPGVFERKWEIDSLSHVVHLAYKYWKETDDTSFADATWQEAMHLIVKTFNDQRRMGDNGEYSFVRPFPFGKVLKVTEYVSNNGFGAESKKIGLIHSTHRSSDDAAVLPFNIPENLFAAHALTELAEMSRDILGDERFASQCSELASTIRSTIAEYGVFDHPVFGKIYAYEIDGFEKERSKSPLFMEDPNVPGFLSLSYLGLEEDGILRNTIEFALSPRTAILEGNPYFYAGDKYQGVGSPHTGADKIWPLSIMMRAMRSDNDEEIRMCLNMLKEVATPSGHFNESVASNNPHDFTRADFGMANSIFAALILRLLKDHPELV